MSVSYLGKATKLLLGITAIKAGIFPISIIENEEQLLNAMKTCLPNIPLEVLMSKLRDLRK